ncbi:hypothetical protein WJX81_001516 [Elliptochloris bilobata]|uniref:Methyltransferase FkbM domain-containing protein n=1 Tax=Elliptochloris bilobata TaxID=381761 RepID=A0AAW1QYG8_9CHLO
MRSGQSLTYRRSDTRRTGTASSPASVRGVGARTEAPFLASVPLLARALRFERVSALNLDCEGCEYALADDMAAGDSDFFLRVDQLALEVHAALPWARSAAHAAALGRLAAATSAAGLELASAEMTPCAPEHEALGCHQAMVAAGHPCQTGRMCQNLLCARRPQHFDKGQFLDQAVSQRPTSCWSK